MNKNGIASCPREVNRRIRETQVASRIFASMPSITIEHLALLFRKMNPAIEAVN
jgi:hypothetical protein